jgi:hypothetical protein
MGLGHKVNKYKRTRLFFVLVRLGPKENNSAVLHLVLHVKPPPPPHYYNILSSLVCVWGGGGGWGGGDIYVL